MRLKYVVYESTLSTADAVPLPLEGVEFVTTDCLHRDDFI